MNEIKCPHCGEVFKVDASGYADIVKQVRDAEFSRDLDERVKAVQREGEQALELERSRSTVALQEVESQRSAQLAEQKTPRLRSWHKRLPSVMPSLPNCVPSSRALPQSARVQASARRLRPVPTLKRRMPSFSARSTICVRSWDAKMTKPSLPNRRCATPLKMI